MALTRSQSSLRKWTIRGIGGKERGEGSRDGGASPVSRLASAVQSELTVAAACKPI